jgi:DNA-binding MarR family transcriptional regulator
MAHNAGSSESTEARMRSKARRPVLTKSQAACLLALRRGKSNTDIAIEAKLDLSKTATSLEKLEQLGLATRGATNAWHATEHGKNGRFRTVPDRKRGNSEGPGPGGQRLLELLKQPMSGREIARQLHITLQRVHQLVAKLHAQGYVRLGDWKRILLIVARADDKTPLLSYGEERVLSAIPDVYATAVRKVRIAVKLPERRVEQIIERLIAEKLVEAQKGLDDEVVYRVTDAGLRHPQRARLAVRAQAPRLPVESERIRCVLSALEAESLRIKEVGSALKIPPDSIRALLQYLKRKDLVQKTSQEMQAPYTLTDKGLETLAEMTRRQAA